MKKVLFAVPTLALALLFTFCNKTNVQEDALSVNPTAEVTERGGGLGTCDVQVFADNVHNIILCGTQTNAQTCIPCGATTPSAKGVEVVVGNGGTITLPAPLTFSVTTNAPFGIWVRFVTANDDTGFVFIPATGCQTFTLNDSCEFI